MLSGTRLPEISATGDKGQPEGCWVEPVLMASCCGHFHLFSSHSNHLWRLFCIWSKLENRTFLTWFLRDALYYIAMQSPMPGPRLLSLQRRPAHLSSNHESALEFLCGRWTCARNAILGKKIPFRYQSLYQIKPLWLFRSGWERAGQEHAPCHKHYY